MTHAKAERRNTIRRVLHARVGALVLALLAGAVARADSEDEIARCARVPSLGERVVCLENALRRTDGPPASIRDEKTSATSAEEASARTSEAATAYESVPVSSRESTAAAARGREAAEFGLDESRKPAESLESIRVTVVAIEKSAYGKRRYVTGDGQVWQQIDQRTPRYPDVPFSAEIRTAAAGSFFLQPLSASVAVRVQRRR